MPSGAGDFIGGLASGLIIMAIVGIAFLSPEPVYDRETCADVIKERKYVELYQETRDIKAHLVSIDAQLANLRERWGE